MARVQIEIPDTFIHSTRLAVRAIDAPAGLHLGNHMVVSYLNEALLSFLKEKGFQSFLDTPSFITPDFAVILKAESLFGDMLRIDMAMQQNSRYGIDLYFRFFNERLGKEAVLAKMAMLFFDYEKRAIMEIPEKFKPFLQGNAPG